MADNTKQCTEVLAGSDVQYIVNKFMRHKEAGGPLYLFSSMVPAAAAAQLHSPGPFYCVSGKVRPVVQNDEGALTVVLEFYLPEDQTKQRLYYDDTQSKFLSMNEPAPLDASLFNTMLTADEANNYLFFEQSPTRLAVNA